MFEKLVVLADRSIGRTENDAQELETPHHFLTLQGGSEDMDQGLGLDATSDRPTLRLSDRPADRPTILLSIRSSDHVIYDI